MAELFILVLITGEAVKAKGLTVTTSSDNCGCYLPQCPPTCFSKMLSSQVDAMPKWRC